MSEELVDVEPFAEVSSAQRRMMGMKEPQMLQKHGLMALVRRHLACKQKNARFFKTRKGHKVDTQHKTSYAPQYTSS